MKASARWHRGWRLAGVGILWLTAVQAPGQGTASGYRVVETGGGQALTEVTENVLFGTATDRPVLRFDFGFSTDEVPTPGSFLDAFTITLQNEQKTATAILVTVDPGGAVWAPPTPGTLALAPNAFEVYPLPAPLDIPLKTYSVGYSVTVNVPAEFYASACVLSFDLFDNQNATASLAWAGKIAIVPEPAPWSIAFVMALTWGAWRGLSNLGGGRRGRRAN